MLYTSYYAQLQNFPKDFVPISISIGTPKWYQGLTYKKVAPDWNLVNHWKCNQDKKFYTEYFYNNILSNISPTDFIRDIKVLSNNAKNIVLLCYEKPTDFCHRHLVADWVNNSNIGIEIKEWEKS